jgi:hypothetical protein
VATIPLPALDIRSPQPPDPLGEMGRIFQMKGMLQNQQLQKAQLQGQLSDNQIRQLQAQQAQLSQMDDQRWRAAMQDPNWDGSVSQLLRTGLKYGVGPQSYGTVAQGLAQAQSALANLGSDQLKLQQGLADHIGEQLQSVQDATPELKLPAQQQAKQNAITWVNSAQGVPDAVKQNMLGQLSQIPDDTYVGEDQLASAIGHNKLHSALVEEALKKAQGQQASTEAALGQVKLNVLKNSKPGDLDTQIDQLAPPNGRFGDLNSQMKTMVNGALSRGDVDTANRILTDGFNQIGDINKETNPSIIQARAQQAAVTARIVEPLRQQVLSQFQNDKDARDKIEANVLKPYQDKMSELGELQSAIGQAQSGNVAAARASLYKLIGVAQPQGTHRVVPTEVSGFQGMGSLPQRWAGSLANALSGDPWTPQMVADIKSFGDAQAQSARTNLNGGIENVDKLYGTNVGRGLQQSGAQGPTPTPQTHQFSLSAWQRANPQGDVNAAKQAAAAQGFKVVP